MKCLHCLTVVKRSFGSVHTLCDPIPDDFAFFKFLELVLLMKSQALNLNLMKNCCVPVADYHTKLKATVPESPVFEGPFWSSVQSV